MIIMFNGIENIKLLAGVTKFCLKLKILNSVFEVFDELF